MKTLNFNSKGFAVGRTVTAFKEYKQGMTCIAIGDKGTIDKITIESFPDLGLFNLRIVHMNFGIQQVSIGEEPAKEFFTV